MNKLVRSTVYAQLCRMHHTNTTVIDRRKKRVIFFFIFLLLFRLHLCDYKNGCNIDILLWIVCVLNIVYIFFFICFSYIDNLDFRISMTGYFQVFMRLITFKCFQWTMCFLKLIDFQYHLLYIHLHQEKNKMIKY